MKKFVVPIIAIIIVIIGIFLIRNLNKNNKEYELAKITEYNYFISEENDLYGVIDKQGNTIIDTKYTKIVIPNPEEDVFACWENEKISFYNSKHEQLFTQFEYVEPIKLKNVASSLNYEKSVLKYKKDNLYGLIDFKGNVIVKNVYEKIENLEPVEGKFIVEKNSKKGVIDLNGNKLVDVEYDSIISDGYYSKKDDYRKAGFIVSNTTNDGYRYGYINYFGKKILDTKYNEMSRITELEEIYIIASDNGKFGVYKEKKRIIPHEYQSIVYDDNTEDYIVQKNKKYGVISKEGKEIIDIKSESIDSRGIYLYSKKTNSNCVYDKNGNKVEISFDKTIYNTKSEDYKISTVDNNNITSYGIMDKNGTQLVGETYRYIEYLYKNYFIAKDDRGLLGVINSNGKVVLELKYDSVQKIKQKELLQVIDESTKTTYIYSDDMKQILSMQNANIDIRDDYVLIYNESEKKYLKNDGTIIEDISKLKLTNFPDKIGEYNKKQVTLENIYYTKNIDE